MRQTDALTGMEAAIVLIAFVVVASTFAHVMLGSGTAAATEGETAVREGVGTASSGMQVHGTVLGLTLMRQDPERLECFLVPVQLAAGGSAVDMSTVSVRVTCAASTSELSRADPLMNAMPGFGEWSVQRASNSDGDVLLEKGESFLVNISPIRNTGYESYEDITIELAPGNGVPLRATRMIPGSITPVTELF